MSLDSAQRVDQTEGRRQEIFALFKTAADLPIDNAQRYLTGNHLTQADLHAIPDVLNQLKNILGNEKALQLFDLLPPGTSTAEKPAVPTHRPDLVALEGGRSSEATPSLPADLKRDIRAISDLYNGSSTQQELVANLRKFASGTGTLVNRALRQISDPRNRAELINMGVDARLIDSARDLMGI